MFKKYKKHSLFLVILIGLLIGLISNPKKASALLSCTSAGQCIGNKKCECVAECGTKGAVYMPGDEDCGSAIIGGVKPPEAVLKLNNESASRIGILYFISNLIRFGTIVAGLITVGNFIAAGIIYISSVGDAGAHVKVRDKITWGITGIIIILSAYTIIGLVGLIFFQDPMFVISPKLESAVGDTF